MTDQADHKMEDAETAQAAAPADKGKGKAPQATEPTEESGDDSSSEESGAEDQVSFPLPLRRNLNWRLTCARTGRARYVYSRSVHWKREGHVVTLATS